MNKWKDETSYSRGAKKRVPRVLTLGLPHGVKLIVHRLVHARDYWFYSIKWNGSYTIKDQQLNAVQVEDAKTEAVTTAASLLLGWSLALREGAGILSAMILDEEKRTG